jgi:hypothetical protein
MALKGLILSLKGGEVGKKPQLAGAFPSWNLGLLA